MVLRCLIQLFSLFPPLKNQTNFPLTPRDSFRGDFFSSETNFVLISLDGSIEDLYVTQKIYFHELRQIAYNLKNTSAYLLNQ